MDKWKEMRKKNSEFAKKAGYDKPDANDSFKKGLYNKKDKEEKKPMFNRLQKLLSGK